MGVVSGHGLDWCRGEFAFSDDLCDGKRSFSFDKGLLRFNPFFAFRHQFGFRPAAVGDNGVDDDGDGAGVFEEGVFRPKFAAVEGDGDDVHFKHFRHARTAEFVAAFFAGRQACAFGENGDPVAFVFARHALFHQLFVCFAAVAAVDAYGFDEFQTPAEKGDFEQLAFGNINLRRKDFLQGEGFPAALVFGADDGGATRDVFGTDEAVFESDDAFERPVEDAYPNLRHFVRPALDGQGQEHEGEK